MAGTDAADLRATVIAAIEALDGWTESRFAPDLFGRDTSKVMHKAYTVGLPSSEIHPRDGRQRVSEGLLVTSVIEVTWAHLLRNDAQSADYSAALTAEQVMVKALRSITSADVLYVRSQRRSAAEGWILTTTTFTALHRMTFA